MNSIKLLLTKCGISAISGTLHQPARIAIFGRFSSTFAPKSSFTNNLKLPVVWANGILGKNSIGSIATLQMKKRPMRKKRPEETEVTEDGNFTVTAYATAEEYDLEKLLSGLVQQELYEPKKFICTDDNGVEPDVLYVSAKYQVDKEPRDIFFFREGTVILWNIGELESSNVLSFLRQYEHDSYDENTVAGESEQMVYNYVASDQMSAHLKRGLFLLTRDEEGYLEKYTFSNAMSLSVKLGIWEASLDKYIDSIAFVTEDLKRGTKIKMSRAEVLRKTGELFALRHLINLSSDLLDTPDFYWDREHLENLYAQICGYFSISRRTKVMNEKLNHCVELAELISSNLNDAHHVRLEWMIIILIMVEVLFEIIHYAERYVDSGQEAEFVAVEPALADNFRNRKSRFLFVEKMEENAENVMETGEMAVQETPPAPPEKTERELRMEQLRLEKAEEVAVYNENVNRNMENRLEYLLQRTQIYDHFISNNRRREEMVQRVRANKSSEAKTIFRFSKTPDFITNGEMRDYQVEGLNWMISLYENGISGILADEMGLGKTLQTISFLGYLKHTKKLSGRLKYLVMVPTTTIQNWLNEFERWCPTLKVVDLQGEKNERKARIQDEILPKNWDVLLTSYQMSYIEIGLLKKFKYHTVILDEGHRIKNENSLTARKLRELESNHRMILTGTPIHNSVHELWALMNWLLPDIFNSGDDFDRWFQNMECINNETVIERLKTIIRPFVLRRIKSDVEKSIKPKCELKVYVGMTKLQREWYQKVLLKEVTQMDGYGNFNKVKLDNLLMHLRKVANHPYLFDGAEEGPPFTAGEHLVTNSGKMVIMDKLLARLKAEGSRVLIFSQMVRMLNIIEDYCNYRGYTYCRIDGALVGDARNEEIEKFNKPGSDKFLFLLSTRAGGLGINLATADSVIIYDSDFNPQMDLQAMDRAHRIGQTKQVHVYKLILENSVDDRIVEAADMKFTLDQKLIKGAPSLTRAGLVKKILTKEMGQVLEEAHTMMADEDLDTILARCEERQKKELEEKSDQMVLQHKYESIYKFDGEDFKEKREKITEKVRLEAPDVPRWSRKGRKRSSYASKLSHLPYYIQTYEPHWFFPKALQRYTEREKLLFMQVMGHQTDDYKMEHKIAQAQPLTVSEREHYDSLLAASFKHWTKEHFDKFITACAEHGRNNIKKISTSVSGMHPTEVQLYWEAFWKNYKQLPDYEKYIRRIEFGEALLATRNVKKQHPSNGIELSGALSSPKLLQTVPPVVQVSLLIPTVVPVVSVQYRTHQMIGQKRPHESLNVADASSPKQRKIYILQPTEINKNVISIKQAQIVTLPVNCTPDVQQNPQMQPMGQTSGNIGANSSPHSAWAYQVIKTGQKRPQDENVVPIDEVSPTKKSRPFTP
uniref:Uncharacterized protein n=1 Tax=Lutzomyia longipalpis TaxID=7200 RepID=A0A1B0CAM9_LUTLO